MSIPALRADLDAHAFGPRGLPQMQEAAAQPSPVPVIVAAWQALQQVTDRTPEETALLRRCARAIVDNQWFGHAAAAVATLQEIGPEMAATAAAELPQPEPAA